MLDEYGVDFRVMHGFGSATIVHNMAEYSTDSEKPLVLIYVGDWASCYLALDNDVDPGPIDVLTHLKTALAKEA